MFTMPGWKPTRAYNGKSGCMCGCNGNYNEVPDSKAFQKRVRIVMNFIGPIRPEAANMRDVRSYSEEPFGGERYIYVDDGNRNTSIYFEKD